MKRYAAPWKTFHMKKNKALFLDRDGIFNELVPWGGELCAPRCWPEVVFYSGLERLSEIKALGFSLILITNQPDIERGITEERFVEEVNRHYQDKYQLDAVYLCPFSSDEHPMKKPNPGMLLAAAGDFNLDLTASFFLGDTEKDVVAAHRAGVRPVLWQRSYNDHIPCDRRIRSLDDLVRLLVQEP